MPEWGLTKQMRASEPYKLDAWWLEPAKVITDPIHGDIFVTRLEQAFIDTPPMQRLRRVRQLGATHLVYPGATHTRFAHSLGAIRAAQDLLDAAMGQRNGNHAVPDLFEEWEREERRHEDDGDGVVTDELAVAEAPTNLRDARTLHRRKLAEAIVLTRLGALLHDLGHLPYGHSIEDDLNLLVPHDENVSRFRRLWQQILETIETHTHAVGEREGWHENDTMRRIGSLQPLREGEPLYKDLRPLILSKEHGAGDVGGDPSATVVEYPFVADVVGNTICADLLDYLPRDHRFTGLPMSLGQRFMSSFYVIPGSVGGLYKKRMALLIHRDGRARQDVVTELIKHLRYRYELQERVLVHHLKLTADAMIGKMFELWHEAESALITRMAAEAQGNAAAEIPDDFQNSYASSELKPVGATVKPSPDLIARWRLEQVLLTHGDDGVLEHLSRPSDDDPCRLASSELARRLTERALYRHASNAENAYSAADLHRAFGGAHQRRNLEQRAARHAGLESDWHVILWVPGPKMRLKLAEVLVDHGKGVAKFVDFSTKGSDIYEDHRRLWTISVFVHPSVTEQKTTMVLAKLAQLMRISWDRYQDQLGDDPDTCPQRLAAIQVCSANHVTDEVRSLILRGVEEQAARGAAELTHDELVQRFTALHDPEAIPAAFTGGTREIGDAGGASRLS